jgi:Domain of unknown function (DUF3883)
VVGSFRGPRTSAEGRGPANFVFRELGFAVEKIGETRPDPVERRDWTAAEVSLIVADYFDMLRLDLAGQEFVKTERNRALQERLNGRNRISIEFKHQNISAVLTGLGLPYVEGYKPRGNYQGLLAQEVEAFLDQSPGFLDRLAAAPLVNPDKAPETAARDLEKVIEAPPEAVPAPKEAAKPWLSRKGRRIDFARRDALNRHLGRLGEQFVVWLERQRLLAAGRDDLSRRVEWVADTLGDGLGFDVLSFDEVDDSERLVEVKTTGLGKFFPFYVTATEVRCSEDVGERFHLFRVFDFGRAPRAYVLAGPLRARCHLEPTLFRATI